MCDTSETYAVLREGFLKFHQDDCNVILHLFTGALGVIGCCCLVYRFSNRSLGTLSILLALYASSLIGTVPLPLVIAVSVFLACVATPIVYAVNLGVVWSVVTVVIAYLGQDAAHYITGEPTFQSTYSGADSLASVANATTWINNFSEHTFFLLPLTVDAAVPLLPDLLKSRFGSDGQGGPAVTPSWLISVHENAWILAVLVIWVGGCYALDSDSGPFPFMFVKNRMLHCNLGTEGLRRDIAAIRKWATHLKPSRETTTHWWFSDLAQAESEAFTRVATCAEIDSMFRQKFSATSYCVSVISGMNEVYVSGPAKQGSSDTVFTTRHIDGPWALVPFCSTYRCILGLDSSGIYTTVFPSVPTEKTCRTGDIVCFDYNREIHLIVGNPKCKEEQAVLEPDAGGDGFRIVLKLHYCVYPRFLWPLGKLAAALSLGYNILFRKLFLFTLTPSSSGSHVMAFFVVYVTILVRFAIEVGVQNMLYVAALYTAGRLVHPTVFLVGTSFVHYLRYMTTYYNRTDVNFGTFKADVLFFKVLAISHIAYRYASILFATPGTSASPVVLAASLVMIVTGSTVSSLATKALGIDGTYFGCELGMCKTEWVTAFPYNVIPHPMIVGQLFAFMGVQLLPEFRAAWPWLMPAHCAMYTLVMLQEQFDVYRGKKAGAPPSGPEKIKSA